MPRSLMLRGLPDALVARLRAYCDTHGLGLMAGATALLAIALDHLDARAAGAAAVNERQTDRQRSVSARRAAAARWAGRR